MTRALRRDAVQASVEIVLGSRWSLRIERPQHIVFSMSAGVRTLDPDRESLQTLREFWFYTLARLISEAPLTDNHIPTYDAFGLKLEAEVTKEAQLRSAIALAEAKAIAADRVLNTLLEQLAAIIHDGKQADVSLPKHQLYFGNAAPAEAARPILGSQLDLMESWPAKLAKETDQPYLTMVAPVTAAVQAAQIARQTLKDARAANTEFRLIERRALFDDYNALSATTFGELRAFALDNVQYQLPTSWAWSCFRHVSRDPGPQTIAEVEDLIGKLQAQIADLSATRTDLEQRAAAQAAAEDEAAKAAADLAAAKEAEKNAKVAAKEAEKKAKAAKKKAKK